jgi:hypothetical protein
MDESYVFIVSGGVTAFAIIRDLLNAAQLRPRAVQPSLRCVTVSVTIFVTISPQTPHTQRNGLQSVLMAIPRSCRGFRRLCAEIDLPPNLTLVGLENCCPGNGTVGSIPTLSAKLSSLVPPALAGC